MFGSLVFSTVLEKKLWSVSEEPGANFCEPDTLGHFFFFGLIMLTVDFNYINSANMKMSAESTVAECCNFLMSGAV